jgi:hypothetical protein
VDTLVQYQAGPQEIYGGQQQQRSFYLITSAFPSQYDSTYAPYIYLYTFYSYWQEKWTKPESLPKRKDPSDNREHLK